jgi:VanZ family protein
MKYATILVSLMILVAVLIPGHDLPNVDIGGYDKLIHLGMFATWTLAVRYDFRTKPSRYYLILLVGIFFSFLTELLQLPVEGRTFDAYDMAADAAGIIIGLLVSGPALRIIDRFI